MDSFARNVPERTGELQQRVGNFMQLCSVLGIFDVFSFFVFMFFFIVFFVLHCSVDRMATKTGNCIF